MDRIDENYAKFKFGRPANDKELAAVADCFNLTAENVDICKSIVADAVIAVRNWQALQPPAADDGKKKSDDGSNGGKSMSRVDVLTETLTNLLNVLDGVKSTCDANSSRLNTITNNKLIFENNLREMRKLAQSMKQKQEQQLTEKQTMTLKGA